MRDVFINIQAHYVHIVQGPRIWNSLHAELHAPDISQIVLRNKLKTYLFDIT